MEYIQGTVYTNLDKYHYETWPTVFFEVPKLNSKLRSTTGKILKVLSITHCMSDSTTPYIKIEVG